MVRKGSLFGSDPGEVEVKGYKPDAEEHIQDAINEVSKKAVFFE